MRHDLRLSDMRTLWLSLILSPTLGACPESQPPEPPTTPAPPPAATVTLDVAGPLTLALARAPAGGTRLAAFSSADHTLVVADVQSAITTERARFELPVTATEPLMVFSPDATRLFVSGTARDQGESRTRPVQLLVDLTTAPATVNQLDELGFASQVAWGRREIVFMDGKVTELDPSYGTPNVVRRCTPETCGTIDRSATRVVTGRGHTLQNVRPWPSLQDGVTLEHLGPVDYLGRLGDRLFVGPGVDGVRSPVWDATSGDLLAALPGHRFETEGELVIASSSGSSGEGSSALDVHLPATGATARIAFEHDGPWSVGAGLLAIADGGTIRVWDLTTLATLARVTAPSSFLAPGVDARAPWAWMFTRGHRFAATHHPETNVSLARPASCRVAWSGTWREDEPVPATWIACRDASAPQDPHVDPMPMQHWAGLWILRDGRPQRADGSTSLVVR